MLADRRPRCVEPEWLDELPADDSRAVRSRRDLRRVNLWMLQVRIMQRLLETHGTGQPPRSIVDLGGGDGTFLLQLAKRLAPRWPELEVTLVDRHDVVSQRTRATFRALRWKPEIVTADVFDFLHDTDRPPADVVMANLFLHHLDDAQLTRLFARVSELAPVFIACEPRRSTWALAGSRLLWAIGCNDVSRHDAVVSVRAGFCANDLSRLWCGRGAWRLEERRAGLFTHSFVARQSVAAKMLQLESGGKSRQGVAASPP